MRTFILPVLALAAALPAQQRHSIGVALATADASGVHANRQIDAVRAGTAVERPLLLQAQDGRVTAASSLAQRQMPRMGMSDGYGASFAWHAVAADGDVAGTLGGSPLAAGAQHYAMLLTSDRSVSGSIVIAFDGAGRNGGGARAAVTVGNESRSFVADGNAQRARIGGLTISGRGLRVDVRFSGHAAGQGGNASAFHAGMRVLFVGDGPRCEVLPGERSCAEGGVLRGSIDTSGHMPVLNLGLTGALPNAIGLTIVSPDGQTFPIANTSCIFFQLPIVHETFRTDGNGNARTQVRFPMRPGGQFFVQQGTILVSPRGIRFGTSNTLQVVCH